MGKGRCKHTEHGGRKPRAYKRSVPTHQFRLDVVLHFETHTMEATLSKFFKGLTGTQLQTKRTSVYFWRQQKERLTALCSTLATANQRRVRLPGMATTLPHDAEVHIVQWINAYRSQGLPVSSLMLQRKALAVARDAGVSRKLFAASHGWAKGFLRRHRLALRARTRQGQVHPEDASAALEQFNRDVNQKMAELGVDCAYNADQTPVFFEYLPKNTISKKGAKTVWVRSMSKDKERLTCMLLGDSLGRKYPPYLIVKTRPSTVPKTHVENLKKRHGFGKVLWRKMQPLQERHNVVLFSNGSGWWNEGLTIDFLRFHFAERADMTTQVLLLLDDFSAHWTAAVCACAKELNVELMRVPAGCTGVCQPADVAWNRPLKLRLRECWVDFLELQMQDHEKAMAAAASFKMEAPDRADVVEWIADAWDELSTNTIANGFKGVLRETEDDKDTLPQIEGVVGRLEKLGLLDKHVGEVAEEQDVVSRVID